MLDLLPDLCDNHPEQVRLLPPIFRQYGGQPVFWGAITTVRCLEDNSKVRELLSEAGQGRVLLIDGGGLSRQALLGDQLAELAVANRWAGIVVYGYVRDVATLATLPLGVQALGAVPMKTQKRGLGDINVAVNIQGVTITPNEYLYADDNGVLIANERLPIDEIGTK